MAASASARPVTRPPLRSVPLFRMCPACDRPLRTTVDFTAARPCRRTACPWCARSVVVCA